MKCGAICTLWITALLTGLPLQAQENLLMKALRDEMGRTMERLQLEDMDRPYYVAYWVREYEGRGGTAILGGLLGRGRGSSSRYLSVELRVGDHDLDNTNFMDFGRMRSRVFRAGFPASLPLRDDYKELRRQIWLATDGAYKQAVHSLAKKRATLQNKTRVEIIPDFSREEPVEYRDDNPPAPLPDEARLEAVAKKLSAVFKEVPNIFESRVSASLNSGTIYFVNSEGSSYVRNFTSASIQALAATQAVDGTQLEDFVVARGRQWKDLPDQAELEASIRAMAERLGRLREAGFVERYNGPVLFEGQAAAELVNQILAPRLLALRTPIADNPRFGPFGSGPQNPFLEKLGSRVLPRFLNIVDDPTAGSHGEAPLLGGYEVDEEGGALQPDNGRPKGHSQDSACHPHPGFRGVQQYRESKEFGTKSLQPLPDSAERDETRGNQAGVAQPGGGAGPGFRNCGAAHWQSRFDVVPKPAYLFRDAG